MAKVYCANGLYLHALDELETAQSLKQKRYNSEYSECIKLKQFAISKMEDGYIENDELFKDLTSDKAKYEGIVTGFNYKKNYGFVNADNKKVFVHISNVVSGYIKNGVKISFEIVKTEKGYQAINIFVN